jgi:outer membrane protein
MTQKRDDLLKQIVAKANAMIKRVAEEEKLDAVFLEAAYVSPRIDITAKVIKALDAER